jgi:hypothetical protein
LERSTSLPSAKVGHEADYPIYAKPPAAALLTGKVARELASTLKRLRLVRSFSLGMALAGPLLHRSSSRCCGEGRFTAIANRLEVGFVIPRQAA